MSNGSNIAETGALSDADIVCRVRMGDVVLFGCLVERYRMRLYRFTARILFSTHDAEDACQNTFVKVWKNLHRYDCERAFSTWILTIAYREACTILSRRRHTDAELPELPDESAGAVENTMRADSLADLWQMARGILPQKTFHALWLHYGEDMPLGDIARVTGRTTTAVKVSLFRARQKLAATMTARTETVAGTQPIPTR